MKYTGPVYRPPLEGQTPLLQVTVGCAHNKCTYCNMYKEVQFSAENNGQIEQDIIELKRMYGYIPRMFLVNGDAFVLRANKLLDIASLIRKHAPECKTITMYASIDNIKSKSDEDLKLLRDAGINDLYIGIESGWDEVLDKINKGHTREEAYSQLQRLNRIGMNHITLLMIGVAGAGKGIKNARVTAEFINKTQPVIIAFSTLGVFEGTELWQEREQGLFTEATELEKLEEEMELIENINLDDVGFFGTHPTNTVPLIGRIPENKNEMISAIKNTITNDIDGNLNSIKVRTVL
ncbi:radical SAM protein [Vibrio hannami]|uniref:radical SAM protein n=1 Tax=Vibrio hannami TaxID=2717094 RepID=UPI00240F413E|nr:radical SAM protein [Vibrio hannami]MDG3088555.1 radical SAM protein [Vibrio hannami]